MTPVLLAIHRLGLHQTIIPRLMRLTLQDARRLKPAEVVVHSGQRQETPGANFARRRREAVQAT